MARSAPHTPRISTHRVHEANLVALLACVVIGLGLSPLPGFLPALLAVIIAYAAWRVALADLWFDLVTLPRAIRSPLTDIEQQRADSYHATQAKLKELRPHAPLPLPRGGLGKPILPHVLTSASLARKALTMAEQNGVDVFTSDPIPLASFTSHTDPALYTFLMDVARAYNVTIEQMDDLAPDTSSPSAPPVIQIRIHATGADASTRMAVLEDAIRTPINLDDPDALARAVASRAPDDPPIIAQSLQRHEEAAAAAANANRTTDAPRDTTPPTPTT